MHVWIALKRKDDARVRFLCRFCVLFTEPASTFFSKNKFKTESHDIIHLFKNYFAAVFSIFSNKRNPNRPLVFTTMLIQQRPDQLFFLLHPKNE